MKRLLLVVPLLGILFLTSCEVLTPQAVSFTIPMTTTTLSSQLPTETSTLIPPVSAVAFTTAKPKITEVKKKDDLALLDGDLVYPAVIQFKDFLVGYPVTNWTNYDYQPVLGHHIDDVRGIKIYNNHDESAVFTVQVLKTTKVTTADVAKGVRFSPTPVGIDNWVSIKYPAATLAPKELATIPFSFKIPVGTIVPDDWEFRLVVRDVTFSQDMMVVAPEVRVLVSMAR